MGWERGYYYRVRKRSGRVVREYIGTGRLAELAAKADSLEQARRKQAALDLRMVKAVLAALDADLSTLVDTMNLVARAALLAAGFHQHKRGQWRKRREHNNGNG